MEWPECPVSLKDIKYILNIAKEHDKRDIVVAYWARIYALQIGIKSSMQTPEEKALLLALMDWLEKTKEEYAQNEAITNEVVSQAHLENYALSLFQYAYKHDMNSNWNKNVVKAFYSSSVIYDILQAFGELSEEAIKNRKYAKWKASYIHTCLKNGTTPIPGPIDEDENSLDRNSFSDEGNNATNEETTNNDVVSEPNIDTNETPEDKPINTITGEASPPAAATLPTSPTSPVADTATISNIKVPTPPTAVKITPEQTTKAQNYCKYAGSALGFDDVPTAITYLQKALLLLTTGIDQH